MQSLAEAISRFLSWIARMSWAHRVVRGALLVFAVFPAAVMVTESGLAIVTLLALAVAGCAVAMAAAPGSRALACWGALLGLWVLGHRMPVLELVALAVVAWLVTRLVRVADSGPSHAVLNRGAVGLLVRDAVVEVGWLVTAGGVLAVSTLLGRRLPGGAWWPTGLLTVLLVVAFAWRAPRPARTSRRG